MELYTRVLDRINSDVEIAERYVIGAVTYLKRKNDGRADRDRVREDILLNRGLEKYQKELTMLLHLSDDALNTVINSSIDLAPEVRVISEVMERVKTSVYFEDEAKEQATKARNMAKMLLRICKEIGGECYEVRKVGGRTKMKRKKSKPIKAVKFKQKGLFD